MTSNDNSPADHGSPAGSAPGPLPARSLVVPGVLSALPLPCFFSSVSSVKGDLRPSHSLQVLRLTKTGAFLVSAYDIHHAVADDRAQIEENLGICMGQGAVVLLDSGKYESYWRRDSAWSRELMGKVVTAVRPSLRFCFDDQDPPADPVEAARRVVVSCNLDRAFHTSPVIPIVHGKTVDSLVASCRLVAGELRPLLLAVAERDLGSGILQRARSLHLIRRTLDEVAPATPIHLLGTGHPVSLAIYSLFGADTFDGLELTYACVDPKTDSLVDFHHRELVQPASTAETPEVLDYHQATLHHNLAYMRDWILRLQTAHRNGTARDFLCSMVPPDAAHAVLGILGESRS
jgi:hypothetical protein